MHSGLVHLAKYAAYVLVGAITGPRLRLNATWWNRDYQRQGLARLEGNRELSRYLAVMACTLLYEPEPAVLDVGCGTAKLYELLAPHRLRAYDGVDVSSEALVRARERMAGAGGGARLFCADFEHFTPDRRYTTVIFNEALYYAPRPLPLAERYAAMLSPGGTMIVSMWERPSRRTVWRALDAALVPVHSFHICAPGLRRWRIGVYRVRESTAE